MLAAPAVNPVVLVATAVAFPGRPEMVAGRFTGSLLLAIVMGLIWIWCWFAQSVSGWSENNANRIEHQQHPISWVGYLGSSDFWQTTLQNWQSELLAVGSMAILSVYLRQRGSPESKLVGAAHDTTGQTG